MVRQAVQQRCGHAFALEDLPPIAERQVAGQQQAAAFIAIGEDLKQQLGSAMAERQVSEFIHDQQIGAIKLCQISIKQVCLLLLLEQIHQCCSGEETDRVSLATRSGGE